jgi:hypothetical protein
MTDLIEVNTADLIGHALDWAVAKAEGLEVFLVGPQYNVPWRVFWKTRGQALEWDVLYNPHEDWLLGGKLIEKYRVGFGLYSDYFFAVTGLDDLPGDADGSTHLVAACRAIVAAKLGETVHVPKGLMP